jgi:hypothetical protein
MKLEVGDMQVSHSWVVTLGIEGCERFRHSSLSAHVQARACMHNKQTSMYTFSILHCDHHSFLKEFTLQIILNSSERMDRDSFTNKRIFKKEIVEIPMSSVALACID